MKGLDQKADLALVGGKVITVDRDFAIAEAVAVLKTVPPERYAEAKTFFG